MNKVLFVTDRNILTTCGELRLIKNRAEALFASYGIATDFLVLQSKERVRSRAREVINAGGSFHAFEAELSRPVSWYLRYRDLLEITIRELKKECYSAVVLSGLGMPYMAKRITKAVSVPIVLDIHGSSEDAIELSKNASLVKKLRNRAIYLFDSDAIRKGLKYSNSCFVVTSALKNYIARKYHVNDLIAYIVPCATSAEIPDVHEYEMLRRRYRSELGLRNEEVAFIYSGGASSWQCIPQTLELYRRIAAEIKQPSKLLIFSHDIGQIRSMLGAETVDVVVRSFKPQMLRQVLYSGDFAFMLREDCVTNNVAFPNKFLEYVGSGMDIIATPYVYEVASQIEKNDLGYIFETNDSFCELVSYISSRSESSVEWKVRKSVLNNNSFEKSLKPFVEMITETSAGEKRGKE
ncbi:glycosyltransferase family 4 protein [Adlercreutzia sp. ZJ242]|uniref:glycosyltransferase family 4 protein n=1 Tax=Adlercreutzia sp. ZJ242 TaxID=2709409 RepID=UPI0013EDA152|nr:glycosyltransferase family 4 protein [Adlercreutzia sp. ZJ242]